MIPPHSSTGGAYAGGGYGRGVGVMDGLIGVSVSNSSTVKEAEEMPLPFESCTVTAYTPTSKVDGTVTVIVLEFTNVTCKGTPIVRATEAVKFSPLTNADTLVPCSVLVGDILCTTGGDGTTRKLCHVDSSLTCSYIPGAKERTTMIAHL